MPRSPATLRLAALIALASLASAGRTTDAGSVMTQYGFFLSGEPTPRRALALNAPQPVGPVPVVTIWALDDGMRTYFLPRRLIDADSVVLGSNAAGLETFEIDQRRIGGGQAPAVVGSVDQSTRFDEFGHRTVTLQSQRGPQQIVQGVTELRPDWLGVDSLNLGWSYGLSTKLRTDEELIALLDLATDREAAGDRLARVRFLIQAGRLPAARDELEQAIDMFPSLAGRAERFRQQADESYGVQAMAELERRRRAGQHALVRRLATAFDPTRVTPETFGKADAIGESYDRLAERNAAIRLAIEELEAELPAEDRAAVAPLRRQLFDELTIDTIDQMQPFEESIEDIGLQPREKLAAGYSSFAGGESQLTLELPAAVRMWELRSELTRTLQARDDYDLREGIDRVMQLEGATVARIKAIAKRLPPVVAAEPLDENDRSRLTLAIEPHRTETRGTIRLQRPPEHRATQTTPLLVVLATSGERIDAALDFWAGSPAAAGHAQRHGYLTLAIAADELADPSKRSDRRDLVLDAIRTVKRRYGVDSDRVFLAGHGRGGALACELGLSRPYDWAGVVSICGRIPKSVRPYGMDDTAENLSLYLVCGELDGGSIESQARVLETMMRKRRDVIICEYRQRGLEQYPAERDPIFEWMELHRRPSIKREWDISARDPEHTEWDWLHVDPQRTVASRSMFGRVNPTNSVIVRTGRAPATVWLSSELVNFDKRVSVKSDGRRQSERPTPSVADTIEDLWRRMDRSRIYESKLEL